MQCVLNLFQKLIAGLKLLGHKMHRYEDRGSVICAIAKNQTGIFANADYRKAGEVIGLWWLWSNANAKRKAQNIKYKSN